MTNAPGYDHGNGHSYFRDSPLVSSDILATLRYDLGPAQRGLIQNPESGVWEFPTDYLARLESAIYGVDPELGRRAKELAAGSATSHDSRLMPAPLSPRETTSGRRLHSSTE